MFSFLLSNSRLCSVHYISSTASTGKIELDRALSLSQWECHTNNVFNPVTPLSGDT